MTAAQLGEVQSCAEIGWTGYRLRAGALKAGGVHNTLEFAEAI